MVTIIGYGVGDVLPQLLLVLGYASPVSLEDSWNYDEGLSIPGLFHPCVDHCIHKLVGPFWCWEPKGCPPDYLVEHPVLGALHVTAHRVLEEWHDFPLCPTNGPAGGGGQTLENSLSLFPGCSLEAPSCESHSPAQTIHLLVNHVLSQDVNHFQPDAQTELQVFQSSDEFLQFRT